MRPSLSRLAQTSKQAFIESLRRAPAVRPELTKSVPAWRYAGSINNSGCWRSRYDYGAAGSPVLSMVAP